MTHEISSSRTLRLISVKRVMYYLRAFRLTVNDDFIHLLVGGPVDINVDRGLLVGQLITYVGWRITGETFRVGSQRTVSDVVVRQIDKFIVIFNEMQGWTLPTSTRYQRCDMVRRSYIGLLFKTRPDIRQSSRR